MTEKTIQKIVAKIDRAVKFGGFSSWESLIQALQSGTQQLEAAGPAILQGIGKSIAAQVTTAIKPGSDPPPIGDPLAIKTRDDLIALFRGIPEPSELDRKKLLDAIDSVFATWRTAFEDASKRMPHDPGGRQARSKEAKAEIRQQVDFLIAQGVERPMAILRVAAQHGADKTTIQRICRESK